MNEALFSDVVMIDRPKTVASSNAPTLSRRKRGGAVAVTLGDQPALHDRFMNAFLQTLVKLNVAPGGKGDAELARLASAMADIATGDSVILKLKPDLPKNYRTTVETFLKTLVRVSGSLEESRLEEAINKLADVILPDELGEARGALAKDNLELRDRFIREIAQLTSAEVASLAGSSAKNPYATAARWKKAGDIFSVQHRGTEYFPAFQFSDGRPRPAIKAALATLPQSFSAWQRAFWFVSANGWLDDKTPVDMLDHPDEVVSAAEHERQEVVG
ncbi:hypothetical protein [Rhizobium sp. Nf11,1]|uniref:hypothetical protein n=1 Tax=unclassified Rhizobium TaxID=2613769 RepID=UPI003D3448DD